LNLFDAAERFGSLDRSQVVMDAGRCLHTRGQFSECAACYEVCPAQAITVGKPPSLDTAKCESCLACIPVCPVGAYQADDDVSDLLNCAAHVEGDSIELLCGLHPHPEIGVEGEGIGIQLRGCLAGLGSAAFLSLTALGMRHITLRTDACRECRWAALHEQIKAQARSAADLLGMWARNEPVVCVEEIQQPVERSYWNAKNPPLSRRDLFRMLGRQGQVTLARTMEKEPPPAERQPGRERRRLLGALAHLPAPETFSDLPLPGFAMLKVSDACTACGACDKGCPAGALHFERDEEAGAFRLSFSPQTCMDCGLCEGFCAPGAIKIESAPSFKQVFGSNDPLLLQSGKLVRCKQCRIWMAERPDRNLCDLCEFRRANPFGSMILPNNQARSPRTKKDLPA